MQFHWELGDVGDGSRLRCLHGKADTTISCVCTCTVGSAQCSRCVVYDPSAMATILVLLIMLIIRYIKFHFMKIPL